MLLDNEMKLNTQNFKTTTDLGNDEKVMTMDSNSIRYIIFLIDSKIKQHDGKIFCNYLEAKEYAINCISDKYCEKAIIGMFLINTQAKEMFISKIETIGFPGDKKNINQLELFN